MKVSVLKEKAAEPGIGLLNRSLELGGRHEVQLLPAAPISTFTDCEEFRGCSPHSL